MGRAFVQELMTFAISAAAIAVAILIVAGFVWVLRHLGWGGAVDLAGIVERWIGPDARAGEPHQTLNVEYRDASGDPIDLGPLIHGTLRNGWGKAFALREGVFIDCQPGCVKAGTLAYISVQDGLIKERLPVQLDQVEQMLFVQSRFRISDLVAKINRAGRDAEAPQ